MSLVDSLDSLLMVFSYAGFPEQGSRFRLFEPTPAAAKESDEVPSTRPQGVGTSGLTSAAASGDHQDIGAVDIRPNAAVDGDVEAAKPADADQAQATILQAKRNAMSNLSIVLTALSILVAFRSLLYRRIIVRANTLTPRRHRPCAVLQYFADHDHGAHRRPLQGLPRCRRVRPRALGQVVAWVGQGARTSRYIHFSTVSAANSHV